MKLNEQSKSEGRNEMATGASEERRDDVATVAFPEDDV